MASRDHTLACCVLGMLSVPCVLSSKSAIFSLLCSRKPCSAVITQPSWAQCPSFDAREYDYESYYNDPASCTCTRDSESAESCRPCQVAAQLDRTTMLTARRAQQLQQKQRRHQRLPGRPAPVVPASTRSIPNAKALPVRPPLLPAPCLQMWVPTNKEQFVWLRR